MQHTEAAIKQGSSYKIVAQSTSYTDSDLGMISQSIDIHS